MEQISYMAAPGCDIDMLAEKAMKGRSEIESLTFTHFKHNIASIIMLSVMKYFNMDKSVLISKTRKREVIQARQQAMALMCRFTFLTLGEIGEKFGKDHATVLYANKMVNNLCETDKEFRDQFYELIDNLKHSLKGSKYEDHTKCKL